jgi:branched-chain amino acid transport system ATP-binding protein
MFALRGIHAGYGQVPVLRDVTLAVPDGSIVALIGPNGAGKTTLLRVACGALAPWQGRLELDGENHAGRPAHDLVQRGICHIPEGRGIFRSLSVRENLVMFAEAGTEAEAVERAVDAFPRLGERIGQTAGTMSGGEQQMLALARAYIRRPRVVLLDEVSMGLAPAIVNDIFAFLLRMAAEGSSLLLVEQYIPKVLGVADYAFILNRGRVTFAGQPSELENEAVLSHYLGADPAASAAGSASASLHSPRVRA